ncbi:MBG domain-containing protein [uncultured Fibrobacter sp.]|uniref:MBG domain-containing protein n=1 Tax=uncultured Fibrobacter sp. TaxID=261512 RepID=UPI00262E277F|nr:MBG domain-containing protein [uncultured Fibrobacter sp.]
MKSFKFLAMLLFTALVSSAWATNKTLSGSESYEAQNGDVLTGLTSGTVTIANGAKITLSDVTISGGIVCSGTAEITLVGTNSVSGATNMAGIQVGGSGTTLTIKGNGSLTANGADNSAGIGLSSAWDVNATGGDIVIEGGNITATGNGMGAGIGTGLSFGDDANHTATIGNITIKGGTVTAIGGTNQYFPGSGIGKGGAYSYGNTVVGMVTITTGIDLVEASSISQSVTYKHGETDVTSIASDYFTINEDGNRRVIVPKDDTDYTITIADGIEHGTLTGATTAKYMEMVTITTTPDFGYRLSRLVVKDAENNDVSSTSNTFLMPKGNVTVSAVFEQGTHGTTEFEWRFLTDGPYSEVVETIYDGLTTVNLQQGWSCQIRKYAVNSYSKFFLDNNTYQANIPYSGGTGAFYESGMNTKFSLESVAPAGYYDITMTDAGNGRWNVSILKTAGQIDVVPDQTYTGSEITPEPLVIAGSLNLTKGTDYVYSYMNNTNAGTATVRATFQGDYSSLGYVEKTFRIIKLLTHSDITIATIPDQTYSGSEICPEISVKDGETTLILGTDYTVECADNVSAGTANMTITGMGDYPGSISKTFEITKAPLTITAKDKTIVYGDEPANDGVEYNGFLGSDDASVLGGTLTYGYNYKKGNKTGEYTITPGGLTADNYEINFVSGTLTVETKKTTFAAIQVFEDENGKRAEINGEYKGEGTVNIPKDIENVSVEFNRTFTVDKYSTIVLPFGIAAGSVEGAVFYKIHDIDVKIVGNDTIWGLVHIAKVTDKIEANTPYLLQPTATKLTFKEPVTLNTSEKHPYGFKKEGVQWEFRGT